MTTHAAPASFTVQPGFTVATDQPGQFVQIGTVPNEVAPAWVAMGAMIEAWWSPAEFGIVCLLVNVPAA